MRSETAAENFTFSFRLEPGSMESALVRRSVTALQRIIGNASAHAISEALAASTDVGSLAQLLSRSDNIDGAVMELEPLVPALARGVEHRGQLLQLAGGVITAQDAANLLRISRQAVDKRRRAGALLAVRQGNNWNYPACQFAEGEGVHGIADVVRQMASLGPWVTLDFLLSPEAVLSNRTPLLALKQGDQMDVIRLIQANALDGFA